MNFFQHQEQARRNTTRLTIYFFLAVASIIGSIYLLASILFYKIYRDAVNGFDWWSFERFVFFAGTALLVISIASLYKTVQLSRGGDAIARLLGGRPIDPNTDHLQQRQLLNVVEEMAIASGIAVPTIYVLEDENSINAFAAGFTPNDAVIGVTKGTLNLLSRDELQGVIAHEFSHIFNGDMRLNVRLLGILHGIMVISIIGYFILRGTAFSSNRKKGNTLPLFGLALIIIGYVGVFFGNLIKSAVSRQREFLADASAVQFTRNPDGIMGALKKIGGLNYGSQIKNPQGKGTSHFFFSNSDLRGDARASASNFNFLSTHPPLTDRIRRIDHTFDGTFPKVLLATNRPSTQETINVKRQAGGEKLFPLLPAQLAVIIGTLNKAHIAHARGLLDCLPKTVRQKAHDPSGARAVILGLLASREPEVRARQLSYLQGSNNTMLLQETMEIVDLLSKITKEVRLPLVDLATPALRRLSPTQYKEFQRLIDKLVRADKQVDLFEYTLIQVLKRHLEPTFHQSHSLRADFDNLSQIRNECAVLLSVLAYAGTSDAFAAHDALCRGAREINGISVSLLKHNDTALKSVNDALDKLARTTPRLKEQILRASTATVAHDGQVTLSEGELLRAVAEVLDLPMPPLLPGQKLQKFEEQNGDIRDSGET